MIIYDVLEHAADSVHGNTKYDVSTQTTSAAKI